MAFDPYGPFASFRQNDPPPDVWTTSNTPYMLGFDPRYGQMGRYDISHPSYSPTLNEYNGGPNNRYYPTSTTTIDTLPGTPAPFSPGVWGGASQVPLNQAGSIPLWSQANPTPLPFQSAGALFKNLVPQGFSPAPSVRGVLSGTAPNNFRGAEAASQAAPDNFSDGGPAKTAGTGAPPKATYTNPIFDSNGGRVDQYKDAQGNQRSTNQYVDFAYYALDRQSGLGTGFTDQFIQRMKVDPIRFYMKAFQDDSRAGGFKTTGEPNDWLIGKAADAAEKDARFLPGAVAQWQKLHGNTDIPPEQFDKWWDMSQNGRLYDGNGNLYGVS